MAINYSTQLTEGARRYPIDDHGKLRMQHFDVPALTVAYAANDTIELCRMPPGRLRILPWLSRWRSSAFGGGRTIDLGHRAYLIRPPTGEAGNYEAEDVDAFIDGLDVSGAVALSAWSATVQKFDVYSRTEWVLFATILGGTMPIGAELHGSVAYLYE